MAGWIRPSIYVHGCTIRGVCAYGCNRQGIAWLRAKRVDRKEIPPLTLGRRGHAPQRNVATPRALTKRTYKKLPNITPQPRTKHKPHSLYIPNSIKRQPK